MCSGTTWYLHVWVGWDLLCIGGHWDLLLLGQHVRVRESRGQLLAGMGQVGLRCRRCWLRGWGYLWMCSLRGYLALRWPWYWAWHHLRVLLGYVALRSLIALGYPWPGLITVLLMWLQLTREWLLVLRGNAGLRGHVSMWEALLSLERRVRSRNSPRSRLVSLRQRLPDGLRVRLRLLRLRLL